jgi:hypothetical protein
MELNLTRVSPIIAANWQALKDHTVFAIAFGVAKCHDCLVICLASDLDHGSCTQIIVNE